MAKPNFIYVGTGKAGTTWLFEVMKKHPNIYVTDVKETNFFDLNYDRGLSWYYEFFESALESGAIGEISHRYLHDEAAHSRIRSDLGLIKILACLRNPLDYIVSDYMFCQRNGRFLGSLNQWIEQEFDWSTVAYREMLAPYIETFGKEHLFVYNFDRVANDPQALIDSICDFLCVERIELSSDQMKPVNVAAKARSPALASIVNRASKALKRRGGQRIIAAVKYNSLVQRVLYSTTTEKPDLNRINRATIISRVSDDVKWLADAFEIDFEADLVRN